MLDAWSAVFVPTANTTALGASCPEPPFHLLAGLRPRVRVACCYKNSTADRERWASLSRFCFVLIWRGMGAGRWRGEDPRRLRPLRLDSVVTRSHHRHLFSPASLVLKSTSLLHYGEGHNFVRVRLAAHSRRRAARDFPVTICQADHDQAEARISLAGCVPDVHLEGCFGYALRQEFPFLQNAPIIRPYIAETLAPYPMSALT